MPVAQQFHGGFDGTAFPKDLPCGDHSLSAKPVSERFTEHFLAKPPQVSDAYVRVLGHSLWPKMALPGE